MNVELLVLIIDVTVVRKQYEVLFYSEQFVKLFLGKYLDRVFEVFR